MGKGIKFFPVLLLTSPFLVPFKIYPILLFGASLVFLFAAILTWDWSRLVGKRIILLSASYFFYILTHLNVLNLELIYPAKAFIDVFFLFAATLYMGRMENKTLVGYIDSFELAFKIIVILNFIQVLVIVILGNLWLHPFDIKNSDDAYLIQNVIPVLFGDENKNIWASKFLLTAGVLFYIVKVTFDRKISLQLFLMASFVLLYTSSRTAQFTFLLLVGYFLYCRYIKKTFYKFAIFSFILILGAWFLTYLPFDELFAIDLSQGHGGDGLLARFIIWNKFLNDLAGFDWSKMIWGSGVYSVIEYVSQTFVENNLHNVFLNQLYDLGLVGLIFYFGILLFYLWNPGAKLRFFVPLMFFMIAFFQYFGYDADLIIVLLLMVYSSRVIMIESLGHFVNESSSPRAC